jgi:uncharacterized protein YndB with AHSA1/START domain
VGDTGSDPIVKEVHVDATPETVFQYFTDPGKLTRWLATEATLDPRPGGLCQQLHAGDDRGGSPYEMRGEFVEVTSPTRVVFTWGFTNPEVGVAPGSSIVEVTFAPEGHGTRVQLVHRRLPASTVDDHSRGWTGLLSRLAAVVPPTTKEQP